ncbi:MAG: sulfur carrier protein ThiS [Muribaculaceae bacterium]|nr:sulfur carrier protein ThiS [Muribaculaceae bacterium]
MNIQVNNKNYEFDEGLTLAKLLSFQNISNEGIAIALNKKVVRRENLDSTILHDGDSILIIKAVCGG